MTEIVTLPRQATRARFLWILPAVFATASVLGVVWPGHRGQLFCIGSIAGIWANTLFDTGGDPAAWLLPTLLGGVPILFFLGRLLDRLQADVRVWGVAMAVVAAGSGYVLIQGFSDIEQAVDYHGSLLAFAVCALQIGAYGATLVALAIGAGRVSRRS